MIAPNFLLWAACSPFAARAQWFEFSGIRKDSGK
jgi:hypothetical protein